MDAVDNAVQEIKSKDPSGGRDLTREGIRLTRITVTQPGHRFIQHRWYEDILRLLGSVINWSEKREY